MKTWKIGLCQIKVTLNKGQNLDNAEAMIVQAKRRGAQMAILPEMFTCPFEPRLFKEFAEPLGTGPTCKKMGALAKRLKIFIVAGSFPERSGRKIFNTSPVFSPAGRLIARHRKIHLFDAALKKISITESKTLSPGGQATVFSTPFGKFGLIICFDLRFPSLFKIMRPRRLVGVIAPAAFTVPTGRAHWDSLLKIRAVDNQIYLAAVSPARNTTAPFPVYGFSRAVDPWGKTVAGTRTRSSLVMAVLSAARIREGRGRLPLLRERRISA